MEVVKKYINYIKDKKKLSNNTVLSYYTDIKKYMDYLEKNGKVSSEISFGNIGRPEYKYSVIKSKLL